MLQFGNNGISDYVYESQNDPTISLCKDQTYRFERTTSGHPLRVVTDSDCSGCSGGTHNFPSSSLVGWVDVQGLSYQDYSFSTEGTYYYLCTAHSSMVGRIDVTSCRRRRLLQTVPDCDETLRSCARSYPDGFRFFGREYRVDNLLSNWPFANELELSAYAKVQEPLNLLDPRTRTQERLLNSKCPENVMVNGRYRLQRTDFRRSRLCYDSSYVLATYADAASAEANCIDDCKAWMLYTAEYEDWQDEQHCIEDVFIVFDSEQAARRNCLFNTACYGYTFNGTHYLNFRNVSSCDAPVTLKKAIYYRNDYVTLSTSEACDDKYQGFVKETSSYPVHLSNRIVYRNNLCDIKKVEGQNFSTSGLHYGKITEIACELVEDRVDFDYQDCIFPFYVPIYDRAQEKNYNTKDHELHRHQHGL